MPSATLVVQDPEVVACQLPFGFQVRAVRSPEVDDCLVGLDDFFILLSSRTQRPSVAERCRSLLLGGTLLLHGELPRLLVAPGCGGPIILLGGSRRRLHFQLEIVGKSSRSQDGYQHGGQ